MTNKILELSEYRAPDKTKSTETERLGRLLTKLNEWQWYKREPLSTEITQQQLNELIEYINHELKPLDADQLWRIFHEHLLCHYTEWSEKTTDEFKCVVRNWLFDLNDVCESELIAACAAWRNSQSKLANRPPAVAGQLKALIPERFAVLRGAKSKVDRAIEWIADNRPQD